MNIKVLMNSTIKDFESILTVLDISENFIEESSKEIIGNFKKSDLKVVDIIVYKTLEEETIKNTIISNLDIKNEIKVDLDGWYILNHILLPTKEWFDKTSLKNSYKTIYFVNGEKFYKFVNNNLSEVDIKEILEINPINTTINKNFYNYFSIFNLIKCYIHYANQILNTNIKCENTIDKDLVFKRDLLQMTINIIKYSIKLHDLEGALIRLNKFYGCGNFCKNIFTNNKENGCCN